MGWNYLSIAKLNGVAVNVYVEKVILYYTFLAMWLLSPAWIKVNSYY